jgi:ankyrin repeat protein
MHAQGWDVNASLGHMGTPLTLAIHSAPETSWLLTHGADPNTGRSGSGATALELAALAGPVEVIRLLVWHGAQVQTRSALLNAAMEGRNDVLDVLLDEGGGHVDAFPDNDDVFENFSGQDYFGSPMHGAAAEGQVETVRYLLGRGARTDLKSPAGLTPREVAVKRGQEECVGLL